MGNIYSHGAVNIGAAHGINARSGCFMQRQLLNSSMFRMNGRPYSYLEKQLFEVRLEDVPGERIKYLYDGPLFKRGWVVQERYLSARMLHFSSKLMCLTKLVKCSTIMCNESPELDCPAQHPRGQDDANTAWPFLPHAVRGNSDDQTASFDVDDISRTYFMPICIFLGDRTTFREEEFSARLHGLVRICNTETSPPTIDNEPCIFFSENPDGIDRMQRLFVCRGLRVHRREDGVFVCVAHTTVHPSTRLCRY
ncbi:hypothetical protein AC579_4690 [Pseudocercospora musae]|uniref:Heterokaryon incompatibility domain-containing protein n=1 Tax=Pseudocercospora musae TaxID=113226 RepID=A0A139IBE6_9PEZI|nr:hypothetical protein AC579_4690 [Pseudocercospora musae]